MPIRNRVDGVLDGFEEDLSKETLDDLQVAAMIGECRKILAMALDIGEEGDKLFCDIVDNPGFLKDFFDQISEWKSWIESERDFNNMLLNEGKKPKRKGFWHNARLWKSLDNQVFERYETAEEVAFLPIRLDPIAALLGGHKLASLPEGSICAKDFVEEDFGWRLLDRDHLYDQQDLSMRKGVILWMMTQLANSLLDNRYKVSMNIIRKGQKIVNMSYMEHHILPQLYGFLLEVVGDEERSILNDGLKSLIDNQFKPDYSQMDVRYPQLKFVRESMKPLMEAFYKVMQRQASANRFVDRIGDS